MSLFRVGLIGAGGVGTSLAHVLAPEQLFSRTLVGAEALAKALPNPPKVYTLASVRVLEPTLDVVFFAVPDDALPEVVAALQPYRSPHTLYLHLAGSVPLAALEPLGENIGVLYPLASFLRSQIQSFADLPLFIEGTSASSLRLEALAHTLSDNVTLLESSMRMRLHAAAVFALNFSNYLLTCADEILDDTPLNYTLYLPLLQRWLQRLNSTTPQAAQTGPARRQDTTVMTKHLALLRELNSNHPLTQIYQLLSEGIENN